MSKLTHELMPVKHLVQSSGDSLLRKEARQTCRLHGSQPRPQEEKADMS